MSSAVNQFVREHPFLTFFIATGAISGIATAANTGVQKANVQKFVDQHPFLTCFIALAAIDGIVTIVRGRSKDGGGFGLLKISTSTPPMMLVPNESAMDQVSDVKEHVKALIGHEPWVRSIGIGSTQTGGVPMLAIKINVVDAYAAHAARCMVGDTMFGVPIVYDMCEA